MRNGLKGLLSLFLVLSLFTGFYTPTAYACSRGPTTQEADYLDANAIFSAKVTRVEAVYPTQKMAIVEPVDAYKGKAPSFVVTNDDSDQCGAGIEAGGTYLFFAQGWDIPYVSVFDTHAIGTARTSELTQWLAQRMEKTAPSEHETPDVYRRGEIRLMLEQQDLGEIEQAFIADNSVYAPLPIVSELLGGISSSVEKQLESAMIAQGEESCVPVRLAAESMGYEVGWIEHNSMVVIHTPAEKQKGPMTLEMRFLTNVGLEGHLEVDRLTADKITYRAYHGHMPPGMDVQPETHPFSDLLKEEIGYRKYIPEFYVKMERNDVRLLAAPELIHKIESDSAFREKVGNRLGEPLLAEKLPKTRLVTVADFE